MSTNRTFALKYFIFNFCIQFTLFTWGNFFQNSSFYNILQIPLSDKNFSVSFSFSNILQKCVFVSKFIEHHVHFLTRHSSKFQLIASEVEVLRLADENPSSLRRIHAVDVDMFLWVHRRNNEKQIEEAKIPFHRVRCIYY